MIETPTIVVILILFPVNAPIMNKCEFKNCQTQVETTKSTCDTTLNALWI